MPDYFITDGGEPEPDQLDMEYHMPLLEELASKASVVIEIGVGKGKNHGDQRQELKDKAEKREAARAVANFNDKNKR